MTQPARHVHGSNPFCIGLLALLLGGCMATISEPRSPEHVAAMRDATRHHHHGRFDEAATAWREAARTARRRVDRDEADYRRARAYRRLDRQDEALALLDDIAGRRPISRRTIRSRFDAALIRVERGETGDALAAFTSIVREHPDHGQAGRSLRLMLEARSREEQLALVRSLFEELRESDLGDDLLTREAEILAERGDRDGAMRVYERIVALYPYPRGERWDDSLWRLADLAQEAGDHRGAIRYLLQMVEPHSLSVAPGSHTLERMPRAGLRVARIYRDELDDPEHAAESFRAMVEEFPRSNLRDDALYELGAMWLDRGRTADGCSVLREVVAQFEVGHARRRSAARVTEECSE